MKKRNNVMLFLLFEWVDYMSSGVTAFAGTVYSL